MMTTTGKYTDWRSIDYQPVARFLPATLIPYLSESQSILDIGCGTGESALFLAEQGHRVLGIDLNPDAIQLAERRARESHFAPPHFRVSDIIQDADLGRFDAVLMVRFLTCLPQHDDWQRALDKAFGLLTDGGIVYIHDFSWDPRNPGYRDRYKEAAQLNWRPGNFAVRDKLGTILFIAHHHPDSELQLIRQPYEPLSLSIHDGLSMHGNLVQMFEFIGRKPKGDARAGL